MERLQAALENARSQRTRQEHAAIRGPQPPAARAGDDTLDALWSELPPITPPDQSLVKHRIMTRQASSAATPFDILRTKVLLQMRHNNWTRLAITSPLPRSGKTTMACNMALGLGRQRELRSILFDLDLREPSVHEVFDHSPRRSIGELLRGEVGFAEQGLRIDDNVAVAMANHPETDPTRILLAERSAEALDRVQKVYKPDVMIFDLPSMLSGDDTRAFLKNVDCALIVARAESTNYSQFDACEREIAEHTNVLGVVLNGCRNLEIGSD